MASDRQESWLGVNTYGVTSDNEILHIVSIQLCEDFSMIL
jgi:hypothetical protein